MTAPALRFSVALDPSHLLRARERMRDYLRLHCADEELVDDIVLCLEEACTNAIRHSGADEEMRIELRFEGEELVSLVSDRGKGFDIKAFDPRAVPDPLASGGRGLYIISQIMDEMRLRLDGGLEVRMVKRDMPRCEPAPLESGIGDLRAAGDLDYRDERLRAMLEEIDEAFVALDWEYRYVHANEAALRMAGKSLGELLGRRPWDLWPAYEDSPAAAAFRAAIELGRPSTIEQQSVVGGDWQETRVYPTSTGLSVYVREINERKQADREREELLETLRKSEQRFRSLFESMAEGVALHELIYEDGRPVDYRILDVNPSFERVTGTKAELANGRLASELYGTGEAPYLEEYAKVAEGGQPCSFETYFAPMERHFRISVVSPSPGQFATVFEDITERRHTEAERQSLLEESKRQAEELQAQGEALRTRNEELQAQGESLQAQRDEAARRASLAEALNVVNDLVHSTLDFETIMQRALTRGVEALSSDAGAIEMRQVDIWVVAYQHGFSEEDVGMRLSDAEAPNATRAAQGMEPVATADVASDPSLDVGFVRAHHLRSVLGVPLLARGTAIGCLLVCGKTPRAFDDAEIDFGRKLGATVSLALENARLYEAEKDARDRA